MDAGLTNMKHLNGWHRLFVVGTFGCQVTAWRRQRAATGSAAKPTPVDVYGVVEFFLGLAGLGGVFARSLVDAPGST